MTVRYATVHAGRHGPPVWVCYIDEESRAYVWVPELRRFALNTAITDDLAWNQEYVVRDIEPLRARELCEEGLIGQPPDPSLQWVIDELADAPSLAPEQVLPARTPPVSRAEQISAVLKRLSARPDTYVVYVSYAADEEAKAKRAASDLRNGRVAAFAKAFPNSIPDVEVLSTEDASRWMVLLKAVPSSKGAIESPLKEPVAPLKGPFKAMRKKSTKSFLKVWPEDRPLPEWLLGQKVSATGLIGRRSYGKSKRYEAIVVTSDMVGKSIAEIAPTSVRHRAKR